MKIKFLVRYLLTEINEPGRIMAWFCVWVIFAATVPVVPAKDAPDWLARAAALNLPDYDKEVPFVNLHEELNVAVDKKGRITKTRFSAIKILQNEGSGSAIAQVIYLTDTDKVQKFRAWLISSEGKVKEYDKDDIVDIALASNDVYNDVRAKLISAIDKAEVGSVFGYEAVVEERSVFGQFEWFFQLNEPVLLSRLSVELPEEWTLDSMIFNHPEADPDIQANTYLWEMRDLPGIKYEPWAPSFEYVTPRLVVSVFPPPGKNSILPSFKTWTSVSRWITDLVDPRVVLNNAMKDRAEALTADTPTEFEKIDAVTRFCQKLNYISIQTGLGRGGGYQPHPATETFEKGYGDCKDKTNLMRALLKAIGITAYPVSVFSGNRLYVREEWPSPQQFNHNIVAVKVDESIDVPAVVHHEEHGSLLIVDPTDPYTRLGNIPGHMQGSLALLIAGDTGGLFRLPVSSPRENRTERNIDAALMPDGTIRTRIYEEMYGSTGSVARAEYGEMTPDAYTELIEAWLSDSVRRASVSNVDFKPDDTGGKATLEVNFNAPRYGQPLQNNLLLFNPNIVSRRNSIVLTESSRELPVVMESRAFEETLRLKLPPGSAVEELPETLSLKEDFGTYRTEYDIADGELIYRRSFLINHGVLPVEQYNSIRRFFLSIRDSEQSPVILKMGNYPVRKNSR